MAVRRASSFAESGAMPPQLKSKRVHEVNVRRYPILAALLVACAAVPAYAQEESNDDSAGAADYYDQPYVPAVPAASASAATYKTRSGSAGLPPQRYIAPDAAGMSYQPGFHGCAAGARINSMGAFGSTWVTRAPIPQRGQDRYVRFGLSVEETYSDNVGLDNDANADSAWVTQVVPTIQACADGGRIKASLNYQLQALYYAGSDESNEIYHDLSAATTMEILPGHFFLSADTSYNYASTDPTATFADNNLLRPGNRTSAWTTNISPYWFQSLGPLGQATLRYRYGRTEYGSDDVSDYTLQGVYLNLSNPPTNTQWSYQLSVASQRVERDEVEPTARKSTLDDDGVTHFDSATLQVGYQLTESFQLLAMAGVENDYEADGDVDRWGSVIWDVGFRWASLTNALEAHYGERAFGSSWSLQATHHAENFDVSLAYDEDTTAAGLNRLNRGRIAVAGGALPGPANVPIQDRGVYVRKRLSATVSFNTQRTHISLQGYDESREYLTSDAPDEDVYGADLSVGYELGVYTSLSPYVRWEHHKSEGNEADIAEIGIGASYALTPSSEVGASYSHTWRDGETAADSYDENLVTAQYSVFF